MILAARGSLLRAVFADSRTLASTSFWSARVHEAETQFLTKLSLSAMLSQVALRSASRISAAHEVVSAPKPAHSRRCMHGVRVRPIQAAAVTPTVMPELGREIKSLTIPMLARVDLDLALHNSGLRSDHSIGGMIHFCNGTCFETFVQAKYGIVYHLDVHEGSLMKIASGKVPTLIRWELQLLIGSKCRYVPQCGSIL